MIIFDDRGRRGEKVNFVDVANVLVGYDMGQDCCEHADWYIVDKITPYDYKAETPAHMGNDQLADYCFDHTFFEPVPSNALDEGGCVAFRLVASNKPDLYLHLFNSHNGYYSHGFEFKINDTMKHAGSL